MVAKEALSNHEELRNEIDILKHLDHPNIIKLYETYENDEYIFLVQEICDGGDLAETLQKVHCTEPDLILIFKQLFSV